MLDGVKAADNGNGSQAVIIASSALVMWHKSHLI